MEMMDAVIQWFLANATVFFRWFGNLFTDAEWKAMVWVICGTLGGTHVVKKLVRACPLPGGGDRQIEALSVIIAFAVTFFVWPDESVEWWIAAMIGAGAANLIFKLAFAVLQSKYPGLASKLNMDRRRVWGFPPADRKPWRKDDL